MRRYYYLKCGATTYGSRLEYCMSCRHMSCMKPKSRVSEEKGDKNNDA